MKKEQLRLSRFIMTSNVEYITKCLFNPAADENVCNTIQQCLEQAKTTQQFIDSVISHTELSNTQCYSELSKKLPKHFYRVRALIGDRCKKAMSDTGSLKIGNDNFTILIPNGYGDGTTRYAVIDNGNFPTAMLNYKTMVNGTFNIYSYDCGNEIAETISGKYEIFTGDGFVVFYKKEER